MNSLPPKELSDEQMKAFMLIPALPNPYYDWLKSASKLATNDSQVAAATEAILEINEERI